MTLNTESTRSWVVPRVQEQNNTYTHAYFVLTMGVDCTAGLYSKVYTFTPVVNSFRHRVNEHLSTRHDRIFLSWWPRRSTFHSTPLSKYMLAHTQMYVYASTVQYSVCTIVLPRVFKNIPTWMYC